MLRDQFHLDGYVKLAQAVTPSEIDVLDAAVAGLSVDAAGTRCLLLHEWCAALARSLKSHAEIAAIIPHRYVAVQCTYFEKSTGRNWLVPIHQDLSIPVASRVDHQALGGWSEKEGSIFVQPPVDVLAQLVAVRLHLDPCSEEDGPLQFVPGTHDRGRIPPDEAVRLRKAGTIATCTMQRGDALLMRPLVLHASSKAKGHSKRRVLHFVFGPRDLPFGLGWARVV